MDDTFVMTKRKDKSRFLDVLNGVCSEIQFTMEVEVDHCLPFVDVTRQQDGHLRMTVHWMSTQTDRILYANSNHPNLHKMT